MSRPYKIDKTGQVFGRWTVLRRHGGSVWWCQCACGTKKAVTGSTLTRGTSKSCGCLTAERVFKHGMKGTPTYNSWAHMLTRCNNQRHKQYGRYGGRGIKVCPEWHSFEAFYADMGKKPKNKSLGRENNDGNYTKSNCRWATARQQSGNQERSLRYEWNGETRTLSDLAHEYKIARRRVYQRMLTGWQLEKALKTKIGPTGPK